MQSFKQLTNKQKVVIAITLFIIFLISVLIGLIVLRSRSESDNNLFHESYPLSNSIEINNEENSNLLLDKITYEGKDLGLLISDISTLSLEITQGNMCDEQKGILIASALDNDYSTSIDFHFFWATIINKNLVDQNIFDSNKVKLEEMFESQNITNPILMFAGCSGAMYWKVEKLNYKLSNFENSQTYLFVGGLQFVPNKIAQVNMTAFIYAYDDINLIQIGLGFNLAKFVDESYKDNCLLNPNIYISYPTEDDLRNPGIDSTCLAKKLSKDNSFLSQIDEYVKQKMEKLNLSKPI